VTVFPAATAAGMATVKETVMVTGTALSAVKANALEMLIAVRREADMATGMPIVMEPVKGMVL
jgi:hypothetical protein